jgi:hypothetical protein
MRTYGKQGGYPGGAGIPACGFWYGTAKDAGIPACGFWYGTAKDAGRERQKTQTGMSAPLGRLIAWYGWRKMVLPIATT